MPKHFLNEPNIVFVSIAAPSHVFGDQAGKDFVMAGRDGFENGPGQEFMLQLKRHAALSISRRTDVNHARARVPCAAIAVCFGIYL